MRKREGVGERDHMISGRKRAQESERERKRERGGTCVRARAPLMEGLWIWTNTRLQHTFAKHTATHAATHIEACVRRALMEELWI